MKMLLGGLLLPYQSTLNFLLRIIWLMRLTTLLGETPLCLKSSLIILTLLGEMPLCLKSSLIILSLIGRKAT